MNDQTNKPAIGGHPEPEIEKRILDKLSVRLEAAALEWVQTLDAFAAAGYRVTWQACPQMILPTIPPSVGYKFIGLGMQRADGTAIPQDAIPDRIKPKAE